MIPIGLLPATTADDADDERTWLDIREWLDIQRAKSVVYVA